MARTAAETLSELTPYAWAAAAHGQADPMDGQACSSCGGASTTPRRSAPQDVQVGVSPRPGSHGPPQSVAPGIVSPESMGAVRTRSPDALEAVLSVDGLHAIERLRDFVVANVRELRDSKFCSDLARALIAEPPETVADLYAQATRATPAGMRFGERPPFDFPGTDPRRPQWDRDYENKRARAEDSSNGGRGSEADSGSVICADSFPGAGDCAVDTGCKPRGECETLGPWCECWLHLSWYEFVLLALLAALLAWASTWTSGAAVKPAMAAILALVTLRR
jgi:hypothetical protein